MPIIINTLTNNANDVIFCYIYTAIFNHIWRGWMGWRLGMVLLNIIEERCVKLYLANEYICSVTPKSFAHRYGVTFMSAIYEYNLRYAPFAAVLYTIACYTGPRFNSIRL